MTKQEFMTMSLHSGIKMLGIKSVDYIERDDYILNVYSVDKEDCYCGNKNRIIGKPILYPLSDYQKIKHLIDVTDKIGIISVIDGDFDFTKLRFDLILKLVQNHFDFLGLIEKGEAINVNTLDVNPYK